MIIQGTTVIGKSKSIGVVKQILEIDYFLVNSPLPILDLISVVIINI